MLKRITIENFKTYINKTVFDFESKNYKFLEEDNIGKNKILKGALFVGENASGKTSALEAIRLIIQILMSNSELNTAFMKSFYTKNPQFSVVYEFDDDIKYEVVFEKGAFVKEKLVCGSRTIIDRVGDKAKYVNSDGNLTGKATMAAKNASFLRQYYFDTHFYGEKKLTEWYEFIKKSVYINCATHRIESSIDYLPLLTTSSYLELKGEKEINDLFKKINYGQDILYSKETPKSEVSGAKFASQEKTVSFRKEGTDVYVPLLFESTGNSTLIAILPAILHAVKEDTILIVDEFSSGLHNALEESLIKYFFHYSNNSQIFFTTHSTNIIDNSIIRPDQIYSIRFDGQKGSVYKRFSDEPIREAQNTEKMFLGGVIDDVPNYSKKFDN